MKKKYAFTMIELIVVIIILAILATYSIPRLDRDTRSEAINHILTMIRYTQNLALHDNSHDSSPAWQRGFWRFQIYKCAGGSGIFYMIGKESDFTSRRTALNRGEVATDPANGKFTFWDKRKACPKSSNEALMSDVSPNIFLTQKYGIKEAKFDSCRIYKRGIVKSEYGGKPIEHIGFDYFGRPHKSFTSTIFPNHWGIAVEPCKITFSFVDSSIAPFTIVVENESGYAYLEENPKL